MILLLSTARYLPPLLYYCSVRPDIYRIYYTIAQYGQIFTSSITLLLSTAGYLPHLLFCIKNSNFSSFFVVHSIIFVINSHTPQGTANNIMCDAEVNPLLYNSGRRLRNNSAVLDVHRLHWQRPWRSLEARHACIPGYGIHTPAHTMPVYWGMLYIPRHTQCLYTGACYTYSGTHQACILGHAIHTPAHTMPVYWGMLYIPRHTPCLYTGACYTYPCTRHACILGHAIHTPARTMPVNWGMRIYPGTHHACILGHAVYTPAHTMPVYWGMRIYPGHWKCVFLDHRYD